MMLDQIYTRSLDFRTLCSDSSIDEVATLNLESWHFIHQCYKSVAHMPLPPVSKFFLRQHLFSDASIKLLEIIHPSILVYKFPNGEVRSFVTSQSGFLLERQENYLWDRCFHFIQHRSGFLSFDLPSDLPVVRDKSSFLFADHSNNFTHFLLDFWALLAEIVSSGQLRLSLPREIPIFEPPVGWQDEYFGLIEPFKPRYFHNLFREVDSCAFLFCPSRIVLPVLENKPLSHLCARNYLHKTHAEKLPRSNVSPLTGGIVFITRNDARRARIRNISAVEDLVISMGGHVVDPVKYSISDRLRLFSHPSVFIAESSGCMNFALFAHKSSRLIALVEPSSLQSTDLLVGGWIYNLGYAARTDYVIGTWVEALSGSALSSADFPLMQIAKLIAANIELISPKS